MPAPPESRRAMAPLRRPDSAPRTRETILTELRRDRATLATLPANDPRRGAMRGRLDRLLDELIEVSRP